MIGTSNVGHEVYAEITKYLSEERSKSDFDEEEYIDEKVNDDQEGFGKSS
uniref:HNH endonuclease n=1 Tax=Lactococcus lactis subsp. cremoris TaxID=1359 RepID=A0A1V0PD13_LACLC